MDFLPETREEIQQLNMKFLIMSHVGAFILDMPDAFESIEKRREFDELLAVRQPELANQIKETIGKIASLIEKA